MILTEIATLLHCYIAKKNNTTVKQYGNIKSQGFTLIELIVVFSVMSILSAFGIASFNSYNETKVLQNAAIDVANTLNLAKSRALSQVKPNTCGANALEGYGVDMLSNKDYQLIAYCTTTHIISAGSLPDSVDFEEACSGTDHSFLFPVLEGGVVENSGCSCSPPICYPWQVKLISGSDSKLIVIDKLGRIKIQ
ncbi:MAG: prepilin-type N-terminal cleavage/methylation domain-containing protein [Candidatus Levybacteria bacterium]|nr:prepilin-type N-terminal cleavage/methylation domain-containing protein [Candidatus Levybacteria bacterium]